LLTPVSGRIEPPWLKIRLIRVGLVGQNRSGQPFVFKFGEYVFGRLRAKRTIIFLYLKRVICDNPTQLIEIIFGFIGVWLYSLLERGEWVQLKDKIHVAEYAKLKDQFTADQFNAETICDLAVEAGCKYVNITTRHHDSFCLFETAHTEFQSLNSPAKRDLVAELVEACNQRGLGIFFYYSHGRDWRHPHAPNNWGWGGNARPKYDEPEPFYKRGEEHDLQKYIEFMSAQVKELLTQYGPVAGIWLDGHATPTSRKKKLHLWKLPELYEQIRETQTQTLISYKGGVLGTEDFFAPERKWDQDSDRPVELCDTLQPHSWGHKKSDNGKHKNPDRVMEMLERAKKLNANLLLNTGPLPDGSIPEEDVSILTEVGKRLKAQVDEAE